MMLYQKFLTHVLLFSFFTFSISSFAAPQFEANSPLLMKEESGSFDYMEVDPVHDRLLAAHGGAGTLVLVNLKTGKQLPSISVGEVHGVAIDPQSETYILGDGKEKKIVLVSSKTLTKVGELVVSGLVDAIAFDSQNGFAYADENDGKLLWVIDVKNKKLVTQIELPGVPEYVVYDQKKNLIYQNIKDKDTLVVIDPNTQKIVHVWSTLPANSPHGLAVDPDSNQALVAGRNGKLVAIDLDTGKVVASAEIKLNTDQITFDPVSKRVYCASKLFISSVGVSQNTLSLAIHIPSPPGAHTIAVDSKRQQIWVSYGDKKESHVLSFQLKN